MTYPHVLDNLVQHGLCCDSIKWFQSTSAGKVLIDAKANYDIRSSAMFDISKLSGLFNRMINLCFIEINQISRVVLFLLSVIQRNDRLDGSTEIHYIVGCTVTTFLSQPVYLFHYIHR